MDILFWLQSVRSIRLFFHYIEINCLNQFVRKTQNLHYIVWPIRMSAMCLTKLKNMFFCCLKINNELLSGPNWFMHSVVMFYFRLIYPNENFIQLFKTKIDYPKCVELPGWYWPLRCATFYMDGKCKM